MGGRGGARPLACLERLWNCAAALLSLRRIRVNTVVEVVCVRVTCCGGECEADPGPLRPSVECRSTFCVVVLCRVVLRGAGVALGCAGDHCLENDEKSWSGETGCTATHICESRIAIARSR